MADEVDVLRPQGRLDGDSSPELTQQALDMIDKGSRRLLIDFREIYYISSAGLRAALAVAKRMAEAGGRVVICAASADVQQVFDVGGFVSVIEMHPTAEGAKARLAED